MNQGIQARLDRIESLLTEINSAATKPLDLDEAAAYLHHSKSHVYQLTSRGLIAHFKPNGKKIYFLKRDLDNYLLRNRRAAADEIDASAATYIATFPTTGAAERDGHLARGVGGRGS